VKRIWDLSCGIDSSKNFCLSVFALILVIASVQAQASTGNAGFLGGNYLISPSADDQSATVQVAGIRNTSLNATTGTLGFELWYSPTPYNGGTIDGYKVAASYLPIGGCTSAQLPPGQSCTSIEVTDTLTVPPAGMYYPVLLLVEFSSTCTTNAGYCIDDFVVLQNLVTGGPTVVVGSVNDGGSGSTGNARMDGPAQVSAIDWNSDTMSISVASVSNVSGALTGSLAIQLWFTTTPYAGGTIQGYKVASFPLPASCTIGNAQLNAAMACDSIMSGTLSVTSPPPGTYYAALVLAEYNPTMCTNNAGYCVDNGLALQSQETVPEPISPVTIVTAATVGGSGGGGSVGGLACLFMLALVVARTIRRRVI
jgi:hypothetical protein